MKTKVLTIVLVINNISEYLSTVISVLANQKDKNFDLYVVDYTKNTNFDDVQYVSNENYAISICETKYIYFMNENTLLSYNFSQRFNNIYNYMNIKQYKIYQLINSDNNANLLYNNSTFDKIYEVNFIKNNKISFTCNGHNNGINHIMFNYCILSCIDNPKKLIKPVNIEKAQLFIFYNNKDYRLQYRDCIELTKQKIYNINKNNLYVKDLLKQEDKFWKENFL